MRVALVRPCGHGRVGRAPIIEIVVGLEWRVRRWAQTARRPHERACGISCAAGSRCLRITAPPCGAPDLALGQALAYFYPLDAWVHSSGLTICLNSPAMPV
jgi:hypothetical protein